MKQFLQAGERMHGRIPGLDGVRAVSVLIVMTSHSGLQHVVPGVFGVTVFFFLSGFLITALLINAFEATGTIDIGAFYLRRMLRLYPPLLVYLGAILVILLAQGKDPQLTGLSGALFYVGNYLFALSPDTIAPYGAHLWSLAVEAHFYLLFPFLFVALIRRPARLLCGLIALCLIALGIRIHDLATLSPPNATYLLVATETRFDSILFGCIAALLASRPSATQLIAWMTHPATVAAALLAVLMSLLWRDPAFRQTARFTVQGMALTPLVLAAVFTPRYPAAKRILNSRAVRLIGALSYSLYLWHVAMFSWAAAWLGGPPSPASYALGWVLTLLIALLVYRLIEQPVLRLRRGLGSRSETDPIMIRPLLKDLMRRWAPSLWVAYAHLRSPREREIALLPLLVRQGCIAVDVGAHTGMYMRPLARIAAHVHAFEPTETFTLLQRSAPSNVTVLRQAVSDRDGEAVLTIPDAKDATTLATLEEVTGRAHARLTVPVVTLDTACGEMDVGFVKIDVEGHEVRVIKGAEQLIARCQPVFLIECEERHRPGALDWLIEAFERSGYRCVYLSATGALTDVAGFDHARDQVPGRTRYINNFIFLPPGHALRTD